MANELVPVTKTDLERKLGGGGLRTLRDLVKKATTSGAMLLLDCSGSMAEIMATGESKIEALRAVVADVRSSVNVPASAFGPAPGVVDVVDQIPDPQGGTPMAQAIVKAREAKRLHLIVISDGVPDSTEWALREAATFMAQGGQRIDAIYIGNDNDYGAKFMTELATVGNGTQSVTDLKEQKLLAEAIRGLLGDGTPAGPQVIQL
jgi:hypothetical protein